MPSEAQEPLPGIARNLARVMGDQLVSIDELERRSEIPEARIREFIEADAEPSAAELLRLAGAMEAPLSWLLQGIAWESDGKGGGAFRAEEPDGD